MTTFQKPCTLSHFCAVVALAFTLPSTLVFAQEAPQQHATHIRIGEFSQKPSGINIINSHFYEEKQKVTQEYDKLVPNIINDDTKTFKRIKINTKIDLSICPFNIGNNTLSAKHLAGALRYYLASQGKNYKGIDAMYDASVELDVDFGVMALSAMLESDFGNNTVSPTSSARGMFQFIDSTWLILMKKYGDRIGHEAESNAIQFDEKTGKFSIKSDGRIARESILAIRNDNRITSLIKAYQFKEEQIALNELGISKPHATDFYIAHLLGLGLAKKLYDLKNSHSSVELIHAGSEGLRSAAELNPYFFYASEKYQPLNAAESYARFYSQVKQGIKHLRNIEDKFGIGEDIDLFRPPCTIEEKS